jgi:5'-deoxynucleotidase YfbR-like HD superfamily hydrolase
MRNIKFNPSRAYKTMIEKAWIYTFTGKKFYLLEPSLENIDIVDIAHSLSFQCRWTGHSRFHYSVAQHSYYCSFLGPGHEALDRLMHDASEAYISDISRALKYRTEIGQVYLKIESRIQEMIACKFRFSLAAPSVKVADDLMLYTEMKQLINYRNEELFGKELAPISIEQWSPEFANQMFLKRFEELRRV